MEMPSSDTGSIDQADTYVHITFIKKWDICAGAALLSALGNVTTIIILQFCFDFSVDHSLLDYNSSPVSEKNDPLINRYASMQQDNSDTSKEMEY